MRRFLFAAGLTLAASSPLAAQGWDPQAILHTETYVKPPAAIERIIMAPRTDISYTNPSPDRKWFVRMPGLDRGDVSEFGKEHINLGGLQIETRANRARTLTTSTKRGIVLVSGTSMATRTIETPKDASISAPTWSPSGSQLAYIANLDDGSYLYVADVASGKSVRASKTALLATLNTTLEWSGDGTIAVVLVPENRGAAPVFGNKGIATGPQVRLTESRALPQVIHPSLLQNPFEKSQLTYYTTGQLALVDVRSHNAKKVGAPAMIRSIDASPDGKQLRVTRMVEPFSYVVPVSSFGSVTEIWDGEGKLLSTVGKTPLREGERTGDGDTPAFGGGRGGQQPATDTGKRNIQWNPVGVGLVYMQSVFQQTRIRAEAARLVAVRHRRRVRSRRRFGT